MLCLMMRKTLSPQMMFPTGSMLLQTEAMEGNIYVKPVLVAFVFIDICPFCLVALAASCQVLGLAGFSV